MISYWEKVPNEMYKFVFNLNYCLKYDTYNSKKAVPYDKKQYNLTYSALLVQYFSPPFRVVEQGNYHVILHGITW